MAQSLLKPGTASQILDATDRLMARYGFRKMTMDDVAEEAGVSKRTIYMYFPSKEELGLSSIGRVVEQVHGELEAIDRESIRPEAKLQKMLVRRVMGRVEQIENYSHSLDELFEVVRPAYMARRAEFFAREKAILAEPLREGMSHGQFRLADPLATAESMVLATNAFLPYSLSVRELGTPDSIHARLTALVDLLLHGVFTEKP